MSEYRWDLHHHRHPNQPRCTETKNGDRCEYITHGGHGHSANDGSHQWLDHDSPVFKEDRDQAALTDWNAQ